MRGAAVVSVGGVKVPGRTRRSASGGVTRKSSRMITSAAEVLFSTTNGTAEPRFSTPEEMDTATVRM